MSPNPSHGLNCSAAWDFFAEKGVQLRKAAEKKNNVDLLATALKDCRRAARRGYKIAKVNLDESAQAIDKVSKSLSECLSSHENGSVRTTDIVEQLRGQLVSVVTELEQLQTATAQHLEESRQKLDKFSVTLFGRTMAGKSTLMEILTNGDGNSIGLGAQRTTRDVRSYEWNGLEVTDVPGVAAFEGAEDEELAFKSAAQADLVLFLITDDAPQPVEAECLAQVRRLGKPVLGICNVKTAIDDEDDLFLLLRNSSKSFDKSRIAPLLKQFHSFADQHTPGKRIPFIVTHLRAKFLAEQNQFSKHREKLLTASRFGAVEDRILREITGRGTFLRTKSFIDGAATPMLDLSNILLDFSAQNSASGRVLVDKKRQFFDWAKSFREDGVERIDTLISKSMDDLRGDVPDFAEEHYDDNQAGEKWNAHVKTAGIKKKVETLQKQILQDCQKALNEVAREIKSELEFVAEFSGDKKISMGGVFDTKRAWNWGTTLLSGGLTIAAVILGSGPLGWAAAAVGVVGWLFSFLFDDREKKAKQAREKLSRKLLKNIDDMERKLRNQLGDWFHQELLRNQVDILLHDLGFVTSGLFELADAQRNLAWTLNDRLKSLFTKLFEEALKQLGAKGVIENVCDIARVPGLATMLLIKPNIIIPERIKNELERLLGENIWFVVDTGNQMSILSQAIGRGCDRNDISVEWKLKVAHVPIDDLDNVTLARIKLAQQLTCLHVMR